MGRSSQLATFGAALALTGCASTASLKPERDATAATAIRLCPTEINNPPKADSDGVVATTATRVVVKGVFLRLAPATKSCLSSGFGVRSGKSHQGIDYYSATDGSALAAAAGVVRFASFRSDYGNMVVIDHGAGVFSLYGHLEAFAPAVRIGARLADGAELGRIGMTGAAGAKHLHLEIREGVWKEPAGVFGLAAVDPFGLPRARLGV